VARNASAVGCRRRRCCVSALRGMAASCLAAS
jgi:hypothetical protein